MRNIFLVWSVFSTSTAFAQMTLDVEQLPNVYPADDLVIDDVKVSGGQPPYRILLDIGKVEFEHPVDLEAIVDSKAMKRMAVKDTLFPSDFDSVVGRSAVQEYTEALGHKPVAGIMRPAIGIAVRDADGQLRRHAFRPIVELTPEMSKSLEAYRTRYFAAEQEKRVAAEEAKKKESVEQAEAREVAKQAEARDLRRKVAVEQREALFKEPARPVAAGLFVSLIVTTLGCAYLLIGDRFLTRGGDETAGEDSASEGSTDALSLEEVRKIGVNGFLPATMLAYLAFLALRPELHRYVPGDANLPLTVLTQAIVAPIPVLAVWRRLRITCLRRGKLLQQETLLMVSYFVLAIASYFAVVKILAS